MGKKRFIVLTLSLLLLPLVSAQNLFGSYIDLEQGVNDLINQGIKFSTPFFENIIGEYSTSQFFFSKILLLILLVIVIKNILDKTPLGEDNKKVSFLIAIIVSVLAIRFINENSLFEAAFIQYGVLGIAITTIIPMVIFFYFIHNTKVGTFGRKMFWGIYAITLFFIWRLKSSEIPDVANWIYGATFIVAIAFIAFDKSIHSYLGISEFLKHEKRTNKHIVRKLLKDLDDLKEHERTGRISPSDYQRERKEIIKQIKELQKE